MSYRSELAIQATAHASRASQPDPEVVAWMRGHLRENPGRSAARTIRAWLDAEGYGTLFDSPRSLRELSGAYRAATKPPLTVADIPAGQGAASLYLTRCGDEDPAALGPRDVELRYREADGSTVWVSWAAIPGDSDGWRALWDHLAATLPAIDTTEESK